LQNLHYITEEQHSCTWNLQVRATPKRTFITFRLNIRRFYRHSVIIRASSW